jgi:hypothetical protein
MRVEWVMVVIGSFCMWMAFNAIGIRPALSRSSPLLPISKMGRALFFIGGLLILIEAIRTLIKG